MRNPQLISMTIGNDVAIFSKHVPSEQKASPTPKDLKVPTPISFENMHSLSFVLFVVLIASWRPQALLMWATSSILIICVQLANEYSIQIERVVLRLLFVSGCVDSLKNHL